MPVRFGNRVFVPSVPGTALALVLLVSLVNLGLWQLRRADEKQALLDAYANGQQQTVSLLEHDAASLPRYQRVAVSGTYDSGRQILLDNMPSASGRPGYNVLTPLRLADGSLILVNRGWLPLGRDRATLPEISLPEHPVEVTGLMDQLPRPGLRLGTPPVVAAGQWPQVLVYPEHMQLEAVYGPGLLARILLLDPAAMYGYERSWQPRFGLTPNGHIGYAVQWFALAAAALAIYVFVSSKPVKSDRNPS